MKHLYVVVEGETELAFVNRLLIPYWQSRGLTTHIQGIMIAMKGGGHGFNNIEHFKQTIEPLLHEKNQPVITTMIDHYGINSKQKLPNYEKCTQETDIEKRISCMEESLNNVVNEIKPYRFFIPNILRHEMETLLYADPQQGFALEKDEIRDAVLKVCEKFPNIEDINHTPEGAPSKRIMAIYNANGRRYSKPNDGVDIADLTGIEAMLGKCPRFKAWVERVIELVAGF
jgi:hypothetical protein